MIAFDAKFPEICDKVFLRWLDDTLLFESKKKFLISGKFDFVEIVVGGYRSAVTISKKH